MSSLNRLIERLENTRDSAYHLETWEIKNHVEKAFNWWKNENDRINVIEFVRIHNWEHFIVNGAMIKEGPPNDLLMSELHLMFPDAKVTTFDHHTDIEDMAGDGPIGNQETLYHNYMEQFVRGIR